MTEEHNQSDRFDKLDAAINRHLEQRRKARVVYWLLLPLVALSAGLVIVLGLSEREAIVANEEFTGDVAGAVKQDKDFREVVVGAVKQDKDFRDNVVGAVKQDKEFREEVVGAVRQDQDFREEVVNAVANDPDAARTFANSPPIRAELKRMSRSPEFAESALAPGSALSGLIAPVIESSAADYFAQPQFRRLVQQSADAAMDTKIGALVTQLQAVENRMSRQIDELSNQVTALSSQNAEHQQAIEDLRGQLATAIANRGARSSSYLLKTDASNILADLDLDIKLGRLSADHVGSVVVSDTEGPLPGSPKGPVRIGESFCITDRSKRTFLATLTFRHERIIVRDFVGLELSRDACTPR